MVFFSLFQDVTMPCAYVIVDMQISDMEQYKHYMAAAPESIKAAGGEYLVRGGAMMLMSGSCAHRRASASGSIGWYQVG
jgi:uncharacterized protein (DUF1330 family)